MLENFRPKSPEELESQVAQISDKLGLEITQPSKKEEILGLSLEEIKKRFPVRYEAYLKVLRQKGHEGDDLTTEEKSEVLEDLQVLNNLDDYIEAHTNSSERTLRDRQMNVFEDMRDFLEEGGRDGYVKLPTGAGKTVLFSEFIEATGLKTLIVVPTKILVGQAEDALAEFAEDLDVGKIYSEAKKDGRDVTIITYQSLVKRINDGSLDPESYKCLILDEAHTSLSDKRIEAVDRFKHAIRLGFTATPRFSSNKHVNQILGTEIHNLGVKEAAEEGVVSPFSVILAETDVDISKVKVTSEGEYSQEELSAAINIEARNRSAVELYKAKFTDQFAVVYCIGIKHAEEVKRVFEQNGIDAGVISGENSTAEQEEILRQFKEGKINVLCNADILIVGFDEQKASVCLNLRPTLSPVVAEQRAGRVLRLDNSNPDKHAVIVDFIDKNEGERNHQITFAEIAGDSVVYRLSSKGGQGGTETTANTSSQAGPEIKIEGLKIVTDPVEVMRVVNKMVESGAKPAPEGWVTNSGLVRIVNRSEGLVRRTAEKYELSHPEWFGRYLDSGGRFLRHYSPELFDAIKKEFEVQEQAPEGWMTRDGLAKLIKRSLGFVKRTMENYRSDHPEWFRSFLASTGNIREHFSPELIDVLKRELETQEQAPEGWVTADRLGKMIDRSDAFVKNILERYKLDHPEWSAQYLGQNGKICEHYSPELVDVIKREVETQEQAPEGWMTYGQLANLLERTPPFIKINAEKYRLSHPEWFHNYLNNQSRFIEFYSPELVGIFRREFTLQEQAPEGWMPCGRLASLLGHTDPFVKNTAEKYRSSHPEWFHDYLSFARRFTEFYSPDLINAIKREAEEQEHAPDGWMTNPILAEATHRSPKTIRKAVEKYRSSHPEWFHDYFNSIGRLFEFYSPELVEKVKEELKID